MTLTCPGVGLTLAAAAVGPEGRVIGVDPSKTMRDIADQISAGVIELRDGTAEYTGCDTNTVDTVLSVNNVMLWDRAAGLAELHRVLRPGRKSRLNSPTVERLAHRGDT